MESSVNSCFSLQIDASSLFIRQGKLVSYRLSMPHIKWIIANGSLLPAACKEN